MRARERLILEALYASWADKDLNAVLACLSDAVVFAIHVPPEVMPFAGETRGKDALVPRLQMILDDFDFLHYRPTHIVDEGDVMHSQVRYHFRHKATGYDIEGTMRHVWVVEGDQVVRFEEFHDTPRVKTFFELLAASEGGKPERDFPNIERDK
jgi:uncharacterized protein